jgi:hypothetical protein
MYALTFEFEYNKEGVIHKQFKFVREMATDNVYPATIL